MFEGAAGITGYQVRRAEAVRRLEETEVNLTRIHDIIGEITPRLGRLARQAEDTKQQAQLSEQLQEALRVWYGYQWQMAQEKLKQTVACHWIQTSNRGGFGAIGEGILMGVGSPWPGSAANIGVAVGASAARITEVERAQSSPPV